MAVPIAAIAKAAAAILTNEKTRKAVGWIIAAILSPVILIIVVICSLMSGTADHNNTAVDLTFHGGSISAQAPAEYRQYIEDMRGRFGGLDGAVAEITPMVESGSIDTTRIKAIFYALFFGAETRNVDYKAFTDCFVTYEERTRIVTDEDGNESEESYTVAVPIHDLATIYAQLEAALGRAITEENRVNAAQIYSRVLYGFASPDDIGIGEDKWLGGVVSYVKNSGSSGYGYHVVVDHGDGMVTLYGHCSKVYVRSGQAVQQGDVIAAVGSTGRSTGNHLHLEVRIGGKKVNPRQFMS